MFSHELSLLALYGLLVLLIVVAQVLAAIPQVGLPYLMSARDDGKPLSGIAARLSRTVDNSVVALALLAPALLILQAKGVSTSATVLAVQAFVIARLLYAVVYAAGVSVVRTLVWTVGFVATAYLYVVALG